MRALLILLCLGGFLATGWHATTVGSTLPFLRGAPQIEAKLAHSAATIAHQHTQHPVIVEADGRTLSLSGLTDSMEDRKALIAAVEQMPGSGEVLTGVMVLPWAEPYTLSITKHPATGLVLSGHAPSADVRHRLLTQARRIGGRAADADRLALAAGTPGGDWTALALAGLAALEVLDEGTLELSGPEAHITGNAPDDAARAQARDILEENALGAVTANISLTLPVVSPFTLMIEHDGNSARMDGFAPDATTEAELTRLVAEAFGTPDGTLTHARGMPDAAWPERVSAAIGVLGEFTSGTLTVADDMISLSGVVETDSDLAALTPLMDESWTHDITVANPTPRADIAITLDGDGRITAEGLLPSGLSRIALSDALPGIDANDVRIGTLEAEADWDSALTGLSILMPRLESGEARLADDSFTISGKLLSGFSAQGSTAALRTVLARGWNLDINLAETPPPAEVMFEKTSQDLLLAGVLPAGIEPGAALDMIGDSAGANGLTGGGDGEPAQWGQALRATGELLMLFDHVTGRLKDGKIEIDGRLRPGYASDQAAEHLAARAGDDWTVDLTAEETPPAEGDRRIVLATGNVEQFTRGRWLPNMRFTASPATCRSQTDQLLAEGALQFDEGAASLAKNAEATLNHLAAIALRCLNSSEMALEIGGHTDSAGNDAANLELSARRAQAVMQALVQRGVRADKIRATGYGEAHPVDTNNTPAGRARNRRISFDWAG